MSLTQSDQTGPVRTVVILGAGGYLGSALCRFFYGLPRYNVTALFHGAPDHRFFDRHLIADAFTGNWVEQVMSPAPFALINCAFDFAGVGEADPAAKYAAFDRSLAALRECGIGKLINISSMSAFFGCRTDYGREKLFVESLFAKYNGVNVRPGLIASWRRPGAAMLRLIDITRGASFVPILQARNSGFYLCDLEALVLGLFLLLDLRIGKPHTLSFCYRNRLPLDKIVQLIETRYAIARPTIPVPWPAAYLLLRVKEAFLGKSKIRADSILDFAYPATSASGRQAFAGVVARYRSELETIASVERAPPGFYFLEGQQRQGGSRSCWLKDNAGAAVLTALGRLADA